MLPVDRVLRWSMPDDFLWSERLSLSSTVGSSDRRRILPVTEGELPVGLHIRSSLVS